MSPKPPPSPAEALACPGCEEAGHPGRIGSRRTHCRVCNRWAQGVIRATHSMLRQYEPEVFEALRAQAEVETYQRVTGEESQHGER